MSRPAPESHPARLIILIITIALPFVPVVGAAASSDEHVICRGTSADTDDPNAILGISFGARTFGGLGDDRGISIAPKSDGSFIVGGRTNSFGAGGSDLWLLAFDSFGRLESEHTVGIELDDNGGYVAESSDHENLIAGHTERDFPGTPHLWLVRTGPFYQRRYIGDAADTLAAMERTSGGGVVLTGRTESFGAGANGDIWVVKLSDPVPYGSALDWQVSLGTPEGLEDPAAIQPTVDGGYVVAGTTTSFGTINQDLWLVKLDSTGSTIVWQKTYGGSDVDRAADVIQTSDGDLVVAGTSYSFQVVGLSLDVWIAKLDSSGDVIWQYAYGTATDDYVSAMIETSDGGLVVVGSTGSSGISDPADAWIMKLDEYGDVLWQKRFLGTATETESFADVAETREGNLIVVGRTDSYGFGGSDLLLVALDLEGNLPRCDVLTDWTATRLATSVLPADSSDTLLATDAHEALNDDPGEEVGTFERDMCFPTAIVQLAKSGQTTTYHSRDDGDLRPGVAWPAERFLDNTDGTVTDLLTGLTWLKDADCAETIGWNPHATAAGDLVWDTAVEFANEVNSGVHDISGCASYTADATDWRLANVLELETLMNYEAASPAAWLETVGFENVHVGSYGYWTSTTFGYWDRMAVYLHTGEIIRSYWSTRRHAWLVRNGQPDYPDPLYPANTPKTGQASSVWEGDDGDHQRGVLWPVPRFRDHGDGTVTDELTGMRWLKDADCFGPLTWDDAFTTLAEFNAAPTPFACVDYLPSDLVWRLPNRKELLSLIEYLGPTATLPEGHPFVNLDNYVLHWTSTTAAHRTDWAWQVYTSQGVVSPNTKNIPNDEVWPVVDASASAVGAGRVPDGDFFPGTPLTLSKAGSGQITLNCGTSCLASDSDYFIYEGTIPDYAHYGPAFCGTGGLTTETLPIPSSLSTYYLVVPVNGRVEGSYGLGAGGAERGRSVWPCQPHQNIAVCP